MDIAAWAAPVAVSVTLDTPRFLLRDLVESDASARYLSWFSNEGARTYIESAAHTKELDDLRRFIRDRVGRDDVLFLGIFDKTTGDHIGNVKFEPVDTRKAYAVMGMLIGESAYRGKGVAAEVLAAIGEWLKRYRGINEIVLEVHPDNTAAIRAYEKAGYRVSATPHLPLAPPHTVKMVCSL